MIRVLAICGSTRKTSSNLHLIRAIGALDSELQLEVFDRLEALPMFNPELDGDEVLPEIAKFRAALRAADAILICTPEYAIGVPGALKNAIDWTVSSSDFSEKPVALITASTSGHVAHKSLLGTLLIIEAKMTNETQLVVPMVKTKVSSESLITDAATLAAIQRLIAVLHDLVSGDVPPSAILPAPSINGD